MRTRMETKVLHVYLSQQKIVSISHAGRRILLQNVGNRKTHENLTQGFVVYMRIFSHILHFFSLLFSVLSFSLSSFFRCLSLFPFPYSLFYFRFPFFFLFPFSLGYTYIHIYIYFFSCLLFPSVIFIATPAALDYLVMGLPRFSRSNCMYIYTYRQG